MSVSVEPPSQLDGARVELLALWPAARSIDLREVEQSTDVEIALRLSMPVAAVAERTLSLASALLARPGAEASGAQEALAGASRFALAVDAVLERPSATKVADLASLAAGELRPWLARVKAHGPGRDAWEMVSDCGRALHIVWKSLGALDRAISEATDVAPALKCETELQLSLKVRRHYRRLWRLVRSEGPARPRCVVTALRRAGTLFAVLTGQDTYLLLREANRLQLRRLQRRVVEWGATARDPQAGLPLWEDCVRLAEALRPVSQRPELLEHDAASLRVAEQALEGARLDEAVAALRSVEGLDDALDAALAAHPTDAALLLAEARRVLARLAPVGAPPGPRGAGQAAPSLSDAPPLQLLNRHVAARATGELVAVGDGLEVHLYLQAGRIAWGTTTSDRFVFRSYLVETFHVDQEALQEALLDGQRTRRPLGETLVAWGMLTPEQVREGLQVQVLAALRALLRCNASQSLFLPRGANYAGYEAGLTFALDELLPRLAATLGAPKPEG